MESDWSLQASRYLLTWHCTLQIWCILLPLAVANSQRLGTLVPMKVAVMTTPIRPYPTDFPPLGSLAVIQALRERGFDVSFLNIDYHRQAEEEIRRYFREGCFDVVGVSAVVSTAYAYTKYIAQLIRDESPNSVIVVGGNLAASAEVLLRLTETDICVLGDGELIFADLVEFLALGGSKGPGLREQPGLSFLDEGEFVFTGYRAPPEGKAISQPDYQILAEDGSLDHYLPTDPWWLRFDEAEPPVGMSNMRSATVVTTKGCVAKCTFCHRFEKGYRMSPAESVMTHVRHLQEQYNVGFVAVGDENFGSHKDLSREIALGFHELGIMWRVAGVRARTVDLETLRFWKAHGCVEVTYGIESGSQTMLDVMQKNTTVEMNAKGLEAAYEAELATALQLVLGMPGETDDTVNETTDFVKKHIHCIIRNGFPYVSVNYAQALPGTPLYEYARQTRNIGPTLDDEEQYLLAISDVDAYEADHFINYTKQPLLKVLLWRYRLVGEVEAFFIREHLGIRLGVWRTAQSAVAGMVNRVVRSLVPGSTWSLASPVDEAVLNRVQNDFPDTMGYFNFHGSMGRVVYLFYPLLRPVSYPILCLGMALKHRKAERGSGFWSLLWEHARWSMLRPFRPPLDLPTQSLRTEVKAAGGPPVEGSVPEMELIRLGR